MTTDPNEQIDDQNATAQPGLEGLPGAIPADQSERTLPLYMNQCIEGGWQEQTGDGRVLEVDSTFSYVVNLEFESTEHVKALMERPDRDQVAKVMVNTLEEMSASSMEAEIYRDFLPESYEGGVIPEDPNRSFTPNTIADMEVVLEDYVALMNSTFPELGLKGATLDTESLNQLPSCYQGLPDDHATKEPVDTGVESTVQSFKM